MNQNRRNFIKNVVYVAGGIAATGLKSRANTRIPSEKMKLSFEPYLLQLRHTFTLANSSRTTTPVMLTSIGYEGVVGYGEASMPPYLGETQETAARFLSNINLSQFKDPFRTEDILAYVDSLAPGNRAAKASVDIALHDLTGKLIQMPWHKVWGLSPEDTPHTSFTIGMDTPAIVRQKVREASRFKILKVKLGRENDREMITTIRSVTDVPLCVDVNEGWKDKQMALEMIGWLKEKGVVFVEQPMPREDRESLAWLTEMSPLPVMADEAVQRLPDVEKAAGVYSGINIKLMKCTGMHEAYKMIILARALGLKVMIGCMTETSCAVSAAAQLSPLAQWADLDGNLLITNDPFKGVQVVNGKITLNNKPGIGIEKQKNP
jgi:L-Ala-D/L-Glu epimerase